MASIKQFLPSQRQPDTTEPRVLPWSAPASGPALPETENDLLAHALRYARIGWHVFPVWGITGGKCDCGNADCANPGKHPVSRLAPQGQKNATTDEAQIRAWWRAEPNANVAVWLQASGLMAFDIDPRNGGTEAIEDIEARHGAIAADVVALTGGGGEHRIFLAPEHGSLPGRLGPGVDIKGNGYIVVAPSMHASGARYEWEASSDPLEGAVPGPMPDWMRDMSAARQSVSAPDMAPARRHVTEQQIEELRSALSVLSADEYHDWIRIGNALRSIGAPGFQLWDEWSQTSSKYSARMCAIKWRGFRPHSISYETVFHSAQAVGWINPGSIKRPPAPVAAAVPVAPNPPAGVSMDDHASHHDDDDVPIRRGAIPVPSHLLTIPGALGHGVAWMLATAKRPDPVYAVQAMLALGSVVCGRRYVTTTGNYASLFFLAIGKSGTGKEHIKTCIEAVLEESGLHRLIGPAQYSSQQGLLSALLDQPTHVTVQDEFGKLMESAKAQGSVMARDTLRLMMEAWGRCHGTIRPTAYSTTHMTQQQADKLKERVCYMPAMTMMAMTTPDTFYDALGSGAIKDGFLNRLIVAESRAERTTMRLVPMTPPPGVLVKWCAQTRSDGCSGGNLSETVAEVGNLQVTPAVVDFSASARQLLARFDQRCVARMNALDRHGLAEMLGRWVEQSMRLALVVALSRGASEIGQDDVQWAIDYIEHWGEQTISAAADQISSGDYDAALSAVERMVCEADYRGLTARELRRQCSKLAKLPPRGQDEVLGKLVAEGVIQQVQIPTMGNRGRKRVAFVSALDHQGAE